MSHTIGKWEANLEAGRPREVFCGDTLICDCGVGLLGKEGTWPEVEANAWLISTAPDGLALAEMVLAHDSKWLDMSLEDCRHSFVAIVSAARALKAKSEGTHDRPNDL